jgi:Uncharacterized small protein (DUF2158)
MALEPGDVVVLKSGGHAMTVVSVDEEDIDCLWIGDDRFPQLRSRLSRAWKSTNRTKTKKWRMMRAKTRMGTKTRTKTKTKTKCIVPKDAEAEADKATVAPR